MAKAIAGTAQPALGGRIPLSRQYEIASGDIVSESFGGDYVVLDLDCGKYFSFSDSANVIWEAVTAGVAPTDLLGPAVAISPAELDCFVQILVEHGLIAPRQTAALNGSVSDYVGRLAKTTEKPEVVIFDDLADLFKADPIHDVEEPVGWPAIRQA
jgi:hypothetical protein